MSGVTQSSGGGAQQSDPGLAASSGSNKLTISLSAIVASLWAGIWGFDWAATHLDPGALFVAIVGSLVIGAAITYYISKRTFEVLHEFEAWQHEAQMRQLAIDAYRAVNHLPPGHSLTPSSADAKVMVEHTVDFLTKADALSPQAKDHP